MDAILLDMLPFFLFCVHPGFKGEDFVNAETKTMKSRRETKVFGFSFSFFSLWFSFPCTVGDF